MGRVLGEEAALRVMPYFWGAGVPTTLQKKDAK
jgi:hypothetical protein